MIERRNAPIGIEFDCLDFIVEEIGLVRRRADDDAHGQLLLVVVVVVGGKGGLIDEDIARPEISSATSGSAPSPRSASRSCRRSLSDHGSDGRTANDAIGLQAGFLLEVFDERDQLGRIVR